MTKCKDCKHYQRDAEFRGWCSIELPAWFRQIVISFADRRFVRSDDGCDLGKEEKQ